jgi:molybdopterin converting factor small subunit
MKATVRVPTVLRPHTGGAAVVEAEGVTLGALLTDLGERHPGITERILDTGGGLHRFVNVFVGDEDVRYLEGLDTPISEGTEVSILPAVAGG